MSRLSDQGGDRVSTVLRRIGREPNAVLGVVTAAINLAVLFGLTLDVEQIAGVNVLLGAVVFLVRWITTPTVEVVASQKPGQLPVAGPAAKTDRGIPVGTPVKVDPHPIT